MGVKDESNLVHIRSDILTEVPVDGGMDGIA
jgi:hypothetical protein